MSTTNCEYIVGGFKVKQYNKELTKDMLTELFKTNKTERLKNLYPNIDSTTINKYIQLKEQLPVYTYELVRNNINLLLTEKLAESAVKELVEELNTLSPIYNQLFINNPELYQYGSKQELYAIVNNEEIEKLSVEEIKSLLQNKTVKSLADKLAHVDKEAKIAYNNGENPYAKILGITENVDLSKEFEYENLLASITAIISSQKDFNPLKVLFPNLENNRSAELLEGLKNNDKTAIEEVSNLIRNNSTLQVKDTHDKDLRKKYFSEGETTNALAILEKISKSSHPLALLANKLIPFAKSNNVKIILVQEIATTKNGIKPAGTYNAITNHIEITEHARFRGLGSEVTILHEILHSLTYHELRNNSKLVQDFEILYNRAKKHFKEYDISTQQGTYATLNKDEFIVALFTDGAFINELKNIKAIDTTSYKNMLEEILDLFFKLFKIDKKTNKSLFEQSFIVTTNILTEAANNREFQQAIEDYNNSINKDYNEILPNFQIEDRIQTQPEKFVELQERLSNEDFLEGAKLAFENSEELQQLGTQEEYNEYVAKIALGIIKNPSSGEFNNSKIKDIVYHGTKAEFEKFNTRPDKTSGSKYINESAFFTTDLKLANKYGKDIQGRTINVIVNLTNPIIYKLKDEGIDLTKPRSFTTNVRIDLQNKGFDGALNTRYDKEIAVFEPEQIHILGGKNDIEGFKEFVSTVDNKHLNNVKNAIRDNLPVEISSVITVVNEVPIEVLGRDDLYLSIKEFLIDNGIKDEVLINWVGINKDRFGHPKNIKSTEQLLSIINKRYDELKDINNHPELKRNALALDSFNKWVIALERYPIAFREVMLTHAVKYLNPLRRAKYVLQLSDVALMQTYGILVGKPHELNRMGKLYDKEVVATLSDAVEHEPSASGKGYWVHIPRTIPLADIQGKIKTLEEQIRSYLYIKNNSSKEEFDIWYNEEDIDIWEKELAKLRQQYETDSIASKDETLSKYITNVELLRKLSPSTWCTATASAFGFVRDYDNYLLIVNGVTVAGIEAIPIEDQERELANKTKELKDSIKTFKERIKFLEKELKPSNLVNFSKHTWAGIITYNITDASKFTGYEYSFKNLNIIEKSFKGDLQAAEEHYKKQITKVSESLKDYIAINKEEISMLENTILDFETEIKREISNFNSQKIQVNEVTSRANNGIASIDYIDDILAFFEKHNLDTNNESLQYAIGAKSEGKTDADMYGYDEAELDEIYYNFIEEQESRLKELQEDATKVNTIQDAITFISELPREFYSVIADIKPEIKNNEEVSNFIVKVDSNNISIIDRELPFYKELAHKAVMDNAQNYGHISMEARQDPRNIALHEIYLESRKLMLEDDLPFSKTNQNLIQGYYDVNTDKVVVVASNISVEEAPRIAIHEVAHRGIVRMAKDLGGIEELSQILFAAENQLMEKLPILLNRTGHKSLESLMLDYGFTTDSKEGKVKLLIELMARWAETLVDKPKPTWWKELIINVRNWITKFTGKTLSETEVNELVGGFVRYGTQQDNENTYYQKTTDIASPFEQMSKTDQVAFEKTVRDLAARMSDRIGIPYKIINNTNEKYKGKLSNGIAYINLAYCDMSTISHEVLGHSIIRALKNKSELSFKEQLNKEVYQGNIEKKC